MLLENRWRGRVMGTRGLSRDKMLLGKGDWGILIGELGWKFLIVGIGGGKLSRG